MSRKRKFLVAAAAMTLLLVFGMAGLIHGQEEYVPQVQAQQVNVERSQVYLTGEGYQLDKQQEKLHQKQEKQRDDQIEKKKQDPKRITPASQPTPKKTRNDKAKKKDPKPETKPTRKKPDPTKKPSSEKPTQTDPTDPTKSEEELGKEPKIRCSISSGEEIDGQRLDFWVRVTDYKGRNVPVFSESDGSFEVFCNGEKLSSEGESGNQTSFRTALLDGQNTIAIYAIDRDGHEKSKTVNFKGNTSAAAEVTGRVYVCIDASILNLGVLYNTELEINRGDTAKDVLQVAFEEAGITPSFKSGYLSGISRSGIATGAWIADETREFMEELRKTEKDPDDQDPNSLKEHDFYNSSGWIYSVNGEFPEKGLGSYKMEDGDELYLIFSLADGVY